MSPNGAPPTETAGSTIVVVTGAAPLAVAAVASIPVDAVVIAADGGLDHARAAGLAPAALVGDLDSVSPAGRAWADEHAEVIAFPTDKGLTDTELALEHAARRAPARVVLIAGRGDRLDHTIAAIGALGGPLLDAVATVDGWWGDQRVSIVRPGRPVTMREPPGTTFSVLALHGPCTGITVNGARWPLAGAALDAAAGRGVSNEAVEPRQHLELATGVLTVIVSPTPDPSVDHTGGSA